MSRVEGEHVLKSHPEGSYLLRANLDHGKTEYSLAIKWALILFLANILNWFLSYKILDGFICRLLTLNAIFKFLYNMFRIKISLFQIQMWNLLKQSPTHTYLFLWSIFVCSSDILQNIMSGDIEIKIYIQLFDLYNVWILSNWNWIWKYKNVMVENIFISSYQ